MAETHDLTRCCKLREKVLLAPAVIPEAACGVSDAELADVMVWDSKSPLGRDVITFRFCPWCGKPWQPTGRVVERAP